MTKIIELAPGLRLAPRSAWGANARYPRLGYNVARTKRTHVFIHHTVMIDRDDATKNIWESDAEIFANMRQLQTVRGPDLGYDVPYSFVAYIGPDGGLTICEGRGEDRTGAHSKGHNTAAIGISFAGDFENHAIEPAQLGAAMDNLSQFLVWLKTDASHPDYGSYAPMSKLADRRPPSADRVVWVHRDIKATACPGEKLLAYVGLVAFRKPEKTAEFPRRNRIDLNTPAELAIRSATAAVEAAGDDPLLTEAVTLLTEAREKVADFVDRAA